MWKYFIFILLAGLVSQSCCPRTNDYDDLNARAASEYLKAIRPASQGRNPCWNRFSKKFIYAPAFDVKAVDGAVAYRFTVNSPDGSQISFISGNPLSDLSEIWADIGPGQVELTVEALDGNGDVLCTAYNSSFLRDFPFMGPYHDKVRPYREAAVMAALFIHNMKSSRKLIEESVPDLDIYEHFTYSNKIVGALVSVESIVAQHVPRLREEALAIARHAAQFLIDQSRPAGDPLEFFPPTYYGDRIASAQTWNKGKTMTMDACMSANAFLDLFDVTGDSLYFDRALKIASTYRKIQRSDGSFPIKVDYLTGEPVNAVGAMLHPILIYVRRLQTDYGVHEFDEMATKAEAWMKDVALESFDLTAQFEDVSVVGLEPYANMTECTACPYASYILRGCPSAEELEDAKDLIRFSEDQFVHWDELPDKDGLKVNLTPSVFEQYKYEMPVDNSAGLVANAYLDLYELTGDRLAFEKAKALIDNITIAQNVNDGQIPTTFRFEDLGRDKYYNFWINCSLSSISALLRMAEVVGEQ